MSRASALTRAKLSKASCWVKLNGNLKRVAQKKQKNYHSCQDQAREWMGRNSKEEEGLEDTKGRSGSPPGMLTWSRKSLPCTIRRASWLPCSCVMEFSGLNIATYSQPLLIQPFHLATRHFDCHCGYSLATYRQKSGQIGGSYVPERPGHWFLKVH